MDYSFKQKNKLWGLVDKHKNWAIKPQYDGFVYDEYIGPDNVFIFKKQNKFYLFTSQLQNLYPEGITDYWFLNEDFNISGYDKNEYAFLVRGENGLYGFCCNYEYTHNEVSLMLTVHLEVEWDKMYNFDIWGFDLIKGNNLYYLRLSQGSIDLEIQVK